MRFSKVAAAAAVSAVAEGAVPSNTTICDYYTTALLKDNSAANQLTVLTLLVNTVVIGNYTKPNIPGITWPDVTVPGILANGTVGNETVHLLPYFDGGLASNNRGGKAVAVNFLDDGGAAPLLENKPANGTTSNQYALLTHLYQFFGTALGCSQQGMGNNTFPAYQGKASQYEVHKYMALNNAQTTYFVQQVGLAAQSFGVADDDVMTVGTLLTNTFNRRCAANATVIPSAGAVQQAICIDDDCTEADNPVCDAYAAVVEPGVANATLAEGLGDSSSNATASASGSGAAATGTATSGSGTSGTASGTASATSGASTGAAVRNVAGGVAAGALGIAAFFL